MKWPGFHLDGRQRAAINQWRSETQNTLGSYLHGVCCSFNPAASEISQVCFAGTTAKTEVLVIQVTHSLARC